MMHKTLLMMYVVNILLVSDLKSTYLSTQKSAGLLLKSRHKLFIYNSYQLIKRSYSQIIMILVYLGFCIYINIDYVPLAAMSIVIAFLIPSIALLKNHKRMWFMLVFTPMLAVLDKKCSLISVIIFICIVMIIILKGTFRDVYHQKHSYFENRVIRIILNSSALVFVLALIIRYKDHILAMKFPLELVFFMLIMFTVARIETVLKNNRVILIRFKSRLYLNMVKKNNISPRLIPTTILKKMGKEGMILVFSIVVSICLKSNLVEGLILMLAIFLQIISVLDLLIFNDVLQSSIIYANKVTKEIVVLGIDMIVFQFLAYYLIQDQWTQTEQPQTIQTLKYVYGLIIVLCIMIYAFRMRKAFRLNKGD